MSRNRQATLCRLFTSMATAEAPPPPPAKRETGVQLTLGEAQHARARWSNPIEFTIACIGYAVGLYIHKATAQTAAT